ncbi:unnamed protein product [Rhizophagus irregularis]|nr:unnamed protein product [Rhizophagus irregularis]
MKDSEVKSYGDRDAVQRINNDYLRVQHRRCIRILFAMVPVMNDQADIYSSRTYRLRKIFKFIVEAVLPFLPTSTNSQTKKPPTKITPSTVNQMKPLIFS